MSKVYVMTIQVAVVANNEAQASDILSEALGELECDTEEKVAPLLDWSYSRVGNTYSHPVLMAGVDPDSYTEGQLFGVGFIPKWKEEVEKDRCSCLPSGICPHCAAQEV